MAVVFVAGFAAYVEDGFAFRNAGANYSLTQRVTDSFKDWKYTSNKICLERYPFKESKDQATWFCMQSRDAEPTLVLLGSSYANQLFPGFAINPLLQSQTILSIGQCDPAKVDEARLESIQDPNPCVGRNLANQQKFYEGVIDRSPSIKYVVLDGLKRDPDPEYIARIKSRIDFLEKRNIRVIVFMPHMRLGFNPRACFTSPMRPESKDCTLSVTQRRQLDEKFQPLVASIRRTNPNALFFDPNDLFCNGETCSMVLDGIPLARDYGHISEFGSEKLQEYFSAWAQRNLPEMLSAASAGAMNR
jgi:hypothetical protein